MSDFSNLLEALFGDIEFSEGQKYDVDNVDDLKKLKEEVNNNDLNFFWNLLSLLGFNKNDAIEIINQRIEQLSHNDKTDDGLSDEDIDKMLSECNNWKEIKELISTVDKETADKIYERLFDEGEDDYAEETNSLGFVRPSDELKDYNVKLEIHKATQEYVDNYIKAVAPDTMTQQNINDVYAGLFEFCCYLYNDGKFDTILKANA